MKGEIVKNQHGVRGAKRLLACQLGITILLATIALLISGSVAATSALLGGLVSTLPNAYFAIKLFRYQGAHAARQIVNSFYKGEASKLVLSVILFTLVFKCYKPIPLVFFAVYIVAQMVFWFAPLIFVHNRK
jgi:ATP synthase protein I